MGYRNNFSLGEWYHCYSRGIDKRVVFHEKKDYMRFIHLLYLMNSTKHITLDDLSRESKLNLLTVHRGIPLVDVGAFALMPNHYHILLKEISERGISRFMQKLGTAYTMYFNTKRARSGGLFTRPFRSRHISDDIYFQYVVDYIHLNPIGKGDFNVENFMAYPFSSFPAFSQSDHTYRVILGPEVFAAYRPKSFKEMLAGARKWEPPGGVASR